VISEVIIGDSRVVNIKEILAKYGINQVQLLIMHPPYNDIIKFSKDEKTFQMQKILTSF
jgi:hypothetical protein